ncbi:DUF2909 domain-containing protein [Thalassotalea ponticola]|uniref:DUF2909 domain-containing protein n=1 Tax=Thalassotalea ponticola TaxID=1523392 RepID=UPI0025B4F063|nr:DUF2909 domain-containing protein [Thalassotalea ponticola]MDN3652284.1 DUF2909 domain-containing protein [Thalassotalea ponticola]
MIAYKIILIILLVAMVYNLFRAGYAMNKNDASKPKMSVYIGRRVLLAILIVLMLIIGMATGIITPNPKPY